MGEVEVRQLRGRVVAAARRLSVERGSALRLPQADLLAAAGIVQAEFDQAFANRHAFLLALLQDFLDLARADAINSLATAPPGLSRVVTAFERYWEANLRWRPMRELALYFRGDPEGAEIMRARLHGVIMIAQYELTQVGWPHPGATARLAASLCVETAIAEYEARRPLPEMRYAALSYFREPMPKPMPPTATP
jgi:hypothetical protein